MGCNASKEGSFDLYDAFKKSGMSEPWSGQYENQFEKDFFMALNLFRFSPGKCSVFIKDLRTLMPQEFKKDK